MSPTTLPASTTMGPGLRRNMVTICAMTATIMQALDTTIANVALPYMQGSLSASQDQVNWVLTSYIVAAAGEEPKRPASERRWLVSIVA